MRGRIVGQRYWIGVVFFLLAAAPGFWLPVLSNVLKAKGWGGLTTWAFLIPHLAGIISPILLGARADNKYRADRILGLTLGGGAVFLFLAFYHLQHGDHPGWFLFFLSLNALVSAPAWSLLMSVALANLEDRERQFGWIRVWGTIGWMLAGWSVSIWKLDASALSGQVATGVRVCAGISCLFLPATFPQGQGGGGWRSALGLGSLRLLRDRDMATYFLTVFLFWIPLSAFYMHTPVFLDHLGWKRVAAGMTIGQISEVVAMLTLGVVLVRFRLRYVLLAAIACGVARYALYAAGANTGAGSAVTLVFLGVALHGVCWTFFFESGRVFVDRRVDPGMRAQSQALLTLVSSGLGGVVGTLWVGGLYEWLVRSRPVDPQWTTYWLVLTAMCLFCGILFAVGYQGQGAPQASARTSVEK